MVVAAIFTLCSYFIGLYLLFIVYFRDKSLRVFSDLAAKSYRVR